MSKETYCVSCTKNTANKKSSSVKRTKQNRFMLVSNCVIRIKKNQSQLKSRSGLLSKLGIRTPLRSIPLINDILF